jgi:hypothetical protein
MKKNSWHLLLMSILCVSTLCWCLYRDIQREKQGSFDFRNRIVGARLQMDGKSPYFYKWKPEHGLRYYDPLRWDTTYANAITATPFFHHLLYPIANLPQRKINGIWLGVQYGLLICSMLIAFSFTKNISQRRAVAITGMICLFTTPWLTLVLYGQIYMLFPFLCLLFIFFFRRQNGLVYSFLSGLTAIAIVLSRPTMLLFFLPFLLLLNKYSLRQLLAFFTPVLILSGYFLLNKTERSFWLDYKKTITAHEKDHLSADHIERNKKYKIVRYTHWEGMDFDAIKKERDNNPVKLKMEFANVKALAYNLFNQKLSGTALSVSFAIVTVLLITFFVLKRWKDPSVDITTAALFGFCLYMISDFFSPIVRTPYYAVQWIFPLLLCASFYEKRNKLFHILLIVGLTLNALDIQQIKMRHTLGEAIILLCLLWFCFYKQLNNKQTEALLTTSSK